MHISYTAKITESIEELLALEQQLRGKRTAVRVQMLRLLKSETVQSIKGCVLLLGYSERHVLRWWAGYEIGGLEGLIRQYARPGRPSRMTPEAWERLEAAMVQGQIGTLEQARQFLQSDCQTTYQSVNALSYHFKRRKTKWKTGRRRHRLTKPQQQEGVKKTLVRHSPPFK